MKKNLRRTLMAGGVAVLLGMSGGMLSAQDEPGPAPADEAAPPAAAAQPAQPAPPAPPAGDQGGPGGPGGFQAMWNMDPAQRQEMIMDRMKERVGATDEEWTAMKPKIQEIMKLEAENRAGMMRGFGGGRGMRGGDRPSRTQGDRPAQGQGDRQNRGPRNFSAMFGAGETPELDALVAATDSESTTNEDLKAKMKAYRDAQKKNADAIKAAREDLRQIVSVRQEAKLIVSGILD